MAKFTTQALTLLALALPQTIPAAAGPDAAIRQQAEARINQRLQEAGLEASGTQLQLLPPRDMPACPAPWQAEAADTRALSRMRFALSCPGMGWRGTAIVRAAVSARVAVAARDLRAGEMLQAEDIAWEERPIADPADLFGRAAPPQGLQVRSALSAGQPLRRRQLQAPQLVKRGAGLRIVARQDGIEVTVAGEALANGRQGEIIPVRNLSSGKTIRARVSADGEVDPLE
ncbi:flagellar basal body P-ring formation chaperone FlgA [Chromobacterium amazonense]|uniref:Flagella basal body P-ring formation protein FlgA n=1 Tax=Chromobacterium amazonense TaxID=1382803 RepID=A0ABU8UXH3_9NEIS|nr:flagellar basal body P-ring formation chaperone FlgA [Chromobacterium amazonense]MDQ4542616.1 flagellar basal body P-ring formation chaperone FlgA [Chromobacterium amazonense]